MPTKTLAAASLCLFACASDSGPELLPGFSPPPPGEGETQYVSPIVRGIQPGEDRIICSYLDAYVDEDRDVTWFAGYQTTGSHHNILFTTSPAQTPNTHDCKDEEMVFFSLIGGTGGDAAVSNQSTLPDGLVRRVQGGRQIVIQTHWLNTGDQVLDGQAAFNVRYQPISPGKTPTDFLVALNTNLDVTPGTSSASVECTFDRPLHIWQLAGHEHELGKHVTLTYTPVGGTSQILFDKDWSREWAFNPSFLDFTATPMMVQAGDKLRVDCVWNNPTEQTVRFPTEMCGALGQFYPSENQLVCLNGDWLGD